jgi:hypothetical protein
MLFLFLLFLFLLFLLRKSRLYKLFPLNGCAITEMGGLYFIELKQRRSQKRTGTASRCLRPSSKHRRTVVIQIETVCPSWLFIKVPQTYASEPCHINGVKTLLEPWERWIIF